MKTLLHSFTRILCIGLTAGVVLGSQSVIAAKPEVEGKRYIIDFKKGHDRSTLTAVQGNNGKRIKKLRRRDLIAADLSDRDLARLLHNPHINKIEEDPKRYPVALYAEAQSVPYGVSMVQSPSMLPGTSPIKVCIIDTGYSMGHPDLPGYERVSGEAQPGTGQWDDPGHSHGTHVAGTIAALDNNEGVIGVHAGTALTLHIVKVFNDRGGWVYGSDLIDALDSCVAAGAQVVSMSLGGSGSSDAESSAFAGALDAGVLSVAAAGNSGSTRLSFPASYDSVVSVAAVDSNKNLASFSQRNSQVELAGPGVRVKSTTIGGNYASYSGTSMATPHVSAAAALVWSRNPGCTAAGLRQALAETAEDLGDSGRDTSFGYGLVQAADADARIQVQGCDVTEQSGPEITPLANGQTIANIGGSTGSQSYYRIDLPAGATDFSVQISGNNGDADLYLGQGSLPTDSSYICRPWISGSVETCDVASPLTPATYYVMLYGYASFSAVSLTASYTDYQPPVNQPPTAVIAAQPVTGKAPLGVDFDSTGSSDDAGIVAREWDFGQGSSGSGMTASGIVYDTEGTYTATLTVTDAEGEQDTDSVVITVSAPNVVPTAGFSATPSSGITTDTAVAFDASDSFDPDSDLLSYSWNFADGASASGRQPTHTFTAAGSYAVTLIVSDGFGGEDATSQTLVVEAAPEPPPAAINLSLSSNRRGTRVSLEWSGASTSKVQIYRNGSVITLTSNDGSWTDRRPVSSARYKVCNDGTSDCSPEVSL